MRLAFAALLPLLAATIVSFLAEQALPAGMPELSPEEFVTFTLLAPARPIAVALLWSRSLSLRTQRDYDHLLPLYKTILALEPTFAPAWDFALYDMIVDLPQRERSLDAKLCWVREAFIRGLEGVQRTPHTSRVAGSLTWALFFIKTRFPSIASRLEEDKHLINTFLRWLKQHHPHIAASLNYDLRKTESSLNLFHISLCIAEIAIRRRLYNYIPVYVTSFCCRELLLSTDKLSHKIYWAKRAIAYWRSLLSDPNFKNVAENQVSQWRQVLAELEARR